MAQLTAQGQRVITGDAARAEVTHGRPPYVHMANHTLASGCQFEQADGTRLGLDDVVQRLREAGKLAADKPELVHIEHPDTGELMRCITDLDHDALREAWDLLVEGSEAASTPSSAGARARLAGHAVRDLSDWTEAERVAGGGHAHGDSEAWIRVKRAVLSRLVHVPRTADDLRLIVLREYDLADGFGLAGEVVGIEAAMDAARAAADEQDESEFDSREWLRAHLDTLSPDHLAALLLGAALEDLLGYGGQSQRDIAAERVAFAERYGVDVVAAARPEQNDNAGDAGGSEGQVDAFEGARA